MQIFYELRNAVQFGDGEDAFTFFSGPAGTFDVQTAAAGLPPGVTSSGDQPNTCSETTVEFFRFTTEAGRLDRELGLGYLADDADCYFFTFSALGWGYTIFVDECNDATDCSFFSTDTSPVEFPLVCPEAENMLPPPPPPVPLPPPMAPAPDPLAGTYFI